MTRDQVYRAVVTLAIGAVFGAMAGISMATPTTTAAALLYANEIHGKALTAASEDYTARVAQCHAESTQQRLFLQNEVSIRTHALHDLGALWW